MLKLPKFANEAEEADWWFNNQDLIAEEFDLQKPKLGPGSALRKLIERRAARKLPETQASNEEPETLPKLPWSA